MDVLFWKHNDKDWRRRKNREGGRVRYSTYPVIRDLGISLSVPPPITSHGRSAGVGGERTGQMQSLLQPRHSSTTLPKLEAVWARAPAGLCWVAVLPYS